MMGDLNQGFSGERQVDLRVGEPSFFYIVLENPNHIQPRTFTVTVSNTSEKVESLVKLLTNIDEVEYWRTYGRLESSISFEGQMVKYLMRENLVESCILQNEIIVRGS